MHEHNTDTHPPLLILLRQRFAMLEVPQGDGGLTEFRSANPHLAPHQPHIGVVGHNTDKCITTCQKCPFTYHFSGDIAKITQLGIFESRSEVDNMMTHSDSHSLACCAALAASCQSFNTHKKSWCEPHNWLISYPPYKRYR